MRHMLLFLLFSHFHFPVVVPDDYFHVMCVLQVKSTSVASSDAAATIGLTTSLCSYRVETLPNCGEPSQEGPSPYRPASDWVYKYSKP
jgi:hypothetical protein